MMKIMNIQQFLLSLEGCKIVGEVSFEVDEHVL